MRFLLQALSIFLLFYLIDKYKKEEARVHEGSKIIEYGMVIKIFTTIVVAFGTFVIVMLIIGTITNIEANSEDWIWMLVIFALIEGLGVPLWIGAIFSKIILNNKEIIKKSIWTNNFTIKYEDIKEFTYSSLLGHYTIVSKDNKKIRISDMMNGIGSLKREIKKRRPEIYK